MKTLNHTEVSQVTGGFFSLDSFFDSSPSWGATIGGAVGSYGGPIGSLVGSAVGHAIETTDYNKMGEDYKNQISDELKNGYIPAD
ncbi:MAG: hypothetical protein Q4A09_08090 [Capnocytophaga felis]|nr:hypothetical protein [Capnocytophaga felis]